jgi:glutathione peroxidase
MFEETHAVHVHADPLYRGLAREAGEYPAWNLHTHLIDRDGRLVGSFPSHVPPDHPDLIRAIEARL